MFVFFLSLIRRPTDLPGCDVVTEFLSCIAVYRLLFRAQARSQRRAKGQRPLTKYTLFRVSFRIILTSKLLQRRRQPSANRFVARSVRPG